MAFYVPEYLDIVSEQELLVFLNEQYFQNKNLTTLESLFKQLRYNHKYAESSYNTDPLTQEISSLVEKIFGFNSFQLIVEQSQEYNAYTFALSSKIDSWNYKKCVKKTNEGLQFTPQAKVNIVAHMITRLLSDDNFTDREIVAILLHEIGHNFSDSINNTLGVFSNFKKVMMIPTIVINPKGASNVVTGAVTSYNDYMRKNFPGLVDCFNALKKFVSLFKYVSLNINRAIGLLPGYFVSNVAATLAVVISQIVYNPINTVLNIIFNFFGKEDEYTSDSFVAMYGYGPDLSSALLKLERTNFLAVDEAMKSGEFGAIYLGLFAESFDFIFGLMSDNHPSTANRLLNVLNLLEQEYNKDYINPKTKKIVKEEIEEIKKLIDDEMQNHSFDGNMWRIMWNKHVFVHSKKGPKDKMVKQILDKIDNHIKE